jgi:hypothetical protein
MAVMGAKVTTAARETTAATAAAAVMSGSERTPAVLATGPRLSRSDSAVTSADRMN